MSYEQQKRHCRKCVRIAEIVLPLAAIAWVAYQVFAGYYHSNQVNADYLGVDFAVHSTLLISISWLAPWFVMKKIRPSLRTSALNGLNKGLLTGLAMIESEVGIMLEHIRDQHARQHRQISGIISRCGEVEAAWQLRIESESPLNSMLIGNA